MGNHTRLTGCKRDLAQETEKYMSAMQEARGLLAKMRADMLDHIDALNVYFAGLECELDNLTDACKASEGVHHVAG